MTERIWFNGRILPLAEVHLSVEDRGFQFADGVYEVARLYDGRPFALDDHLARLERSAAGIEIQLPLSRADLAAQINQYLSQIDVGEGMLYLQLTRGAAPRNHLFPPQSAPGKLQPTLLFYFRPLPPLPTVEQTPGVKLWTTPDDRWQRCWIKSIALLPNVLAKNAAAAKGGDEAVFIDNGAITECSASNIFAVLNGKLITHPVGNKVLPGVTRAILLTLAPTLGIEIQERPWTEEEASKATELFITSTTRELSWVAQWNGLPTGATQPGPITSRLHTAFKKYVNGD
jgi:D-alanine transaminase